MNVVRLDMTVEQVEEIKDVIQNYEKGNGSFNILAFELAEGVPEPLKVYFRLPVKFSEQT